MSTNTIEAANSGTRQKPAGKPKPEPSNQAEVIAMMKQKGATQPESKEATGWQKHTVRGFVSILGSEGGEKIESSKNAADESTSITLAGKTVKRNLSRLGRMLANGICKRPIGESASFL